MPRLARLAATLPLCVLLASPAVAQQFFNFELTSTFEGLAPPAPGAKPVLNDPDDGIDTTFIISGQTFAPSGTLAIGNPVTAAVNLSTVSLSVSGRLPDAAPALFLEKATYGMLGENFTMKAAPVFRFTETASGIGIRSDQPLDSLVFELSFDVTPPWFGFGGQPGTNTALTTTRGEAFGEPNIVDFSVSFRSDNITAQTSATLVPEINGSAFAYIAFIFGALGLLLYSGAGRREVEGRMA